MLSLLALPVLLALLQPAPSPQPLPTPIVPSSPPAPATAAPTPAPTPVATQTPAIPSPSPSPSPLFAYVVDPSPAPSGAPQIVEISLNDRVLHAGGMLLVKVTTSADITTLFARAMGHQIGIPLIQSGIFAGQTQLPSGIPGFLLGREYTVDFVGTTADGRTTTASLPIRLER
jgi:hypothetical protein